MEIVPTSNKEKYGLEMLALRKAELKQQIQEQQQQLSASAQHLLSPLSISSYLFNAFYKSINLADGVMIGYKIARSIRRLFRSK